MLTEREEKLIKRYCIYPKLAMTGVIMALALGVPYVLLEMIDDLAFHDDRAVFWGLYVYIGFVILYMVLFCWCALAPPLRDAPGGMAGAAAPGRCPAKPNRLFRGSRRGHGHERRRAADAEKRK